MVVGYHLIWTAYGWWLPNDPRGSMSQEIRIERIADLGKLHYGRKSKQPLPSELRRFYEEAEKKLKHELLTFGPDDVQIIGEGLAAAIKNYKYTCYACAIMMDHVHMLIRRHRDKAEDMLLKLQTDTRRALVESRNRPVEHPVWGGPGRKVFLNTRADMEHIVSYIENNPIKARRPAQHWFFVARYDGWMPAPAFR